MLYKIAKPIAHIAFSIYFRRIFFSNVQNIPANKPVILALNHPTAFVEPCIVASFQDRPLNFLARGDFFANPLLAKVLRGFHIIPIFRLQDGGYDKLKQNFESFKECYQAFEENKVVLIMAEGGTEFEKRLRPLKKGTARLAFGALENNPELDLYIVPVGVNYTKAEEMSSIAMLNFCEPIRVQDYWTMHQEHPAKAIKKVTTELKETLSANVIQIEKGEEEWVDFLLEISRNDSEFELMKEENNSRKLLNEENKLSKKIAVFNGDKKEKLKKQALDYKQSLEQYNVQDLGILVNKVKGKQSGILPIIGLPIATVGWLLNFSPMWLAKKGAKILIPNDLTFEVPIKITLAIVLYPVYLFIFLCIGMITGNYLWLVCCLIIPISGKTYLNYNNQFKGFWQGRKVKKLPINVLKRLTKQRKELVEVLKEK